ncbi:aa3-type cytochrome oxidase subunit II [Cellulomonas citrea]|uniref:aa3-type cytochrome oxidase subunit II n=1 Tax=Cellulomonas citrea TaxID=1909423 RepID=UPI001F454FC2|nr:cytochrome c oxidase subunit II [Cellulomonas citrea]
MRRQTTRQRVAVASVLAVGASLALSGCSDTLWRGFLPGYSGDEVTNHTGQITSLWRGSWIAALAVGLLTWGLILWCIAVYRKRRDDNTLPVQLRYHVPLEIMYVILPILMVGVLYYYTNRSMTDITTVSGDADVNVQVIGKQWSWDVNYTDADVHDSGVQAQDLGTSVTAVADQVTIWLPVDKKVRFTVDSRDVIHSFWVPAFLFKMDAIPGRTNTFDVTPTREGTYEGKCAELCGEYHAAMLFNVKVVSEAQYEQHLADLRAQGKTGILGLEYSRLQDVNGVTTNGDQG